MKKTIKVTLGDHDSNGSNDEITIKRITSENIKNIQDTKACCEISVDKFKTEFTKLSFIEQKFLTLSIIDNDYDYELADGKAANTQENIEVEKLFRLEPHMKSIMKKVMNDILKSDGGFGSDDKVVLTDENGDIYSTKDKDIVPVTEGKEPEDLEPLVDTNGKMFKINNPVKTLVGAKDGKNIRKGSKCIVIDINIKEHRVCIRDKNGVEETYKESELEALDRTAKETIELHEETKRLGNL